MNATNSLTVDLELLKQSKGQKLVHLNIRSLLANIEEVRSDLLDGSIDIVALSETWLHSQCSDSLLQVPNYNLFRHDRLTKVPNGKTKRGGGIAVYIKTDFDVKLWPSLSVSNADLELFCVSCKLGSNKRINLFIVYRPPTGKLQAAIDFLNDSISEVRRQTSGDVVVMGDFNVDLLCNNAQSRSLTLFSTTSRINQLIESPTRITSTTNSLIDHIYTDITHLSSKGTLDYSITDHLPIFLVKKKA